MHQEISKRENISALRVMTLMIIAAISLTLFNFFANLVFEKSNLIDGITIIVASILAYLLIRTYIISYKYMIIGDEFIIQEVIGSKEKILLNINVNQLIKIEKKTHENYKRDKNKTYFSKRKMNNTLSKTGTYYCIYEEDEKLYFIEIHPSKKLIDMIIGRRINV